MKPWQEVAKGLWKENPIFRLVLGMCPTLAVTTSAVNGLGMGMATTFVLLCSNAVVSLIRSVIPAKVRIPAYIVVIAAFVTVVDLVMNAYAHDLHKALGVFIPLIVVNCIILGRAEAFAGKNGVAASAADGLGIGLGFTISLFFLGSVREILGEGTWLGMHVMWSSFAPFKFMVRAPGAFVTLGTTLALINWISARLETRRH